MLNIFIKKFNLDSGKFGFIYSFERFINSTPWRLWNRNPGCRYPSKVLLHTITFIYHFYTQLHYLIYNLALIRVILGILFVNNILFV